MRRCASTLGLLALLLALPAGAAVDAGPPAPPAGPQRAALAQPPVRAPIASERIYFVMPDRYANGDPANDRGGRTGGRTATGFDPADPGWFHGGDLRGLTGGCETGNGLARIRRLGFTAVWITPPYAQKAVQGDSAAYHGYWITDFTSVDPHLGSEADFAAFVECAHRLGLKVYLDVVVNHTADVIVPEGGSAYSAAPYRDCRGRVFDPARHAGGTTFPCLSARRMPRIPRVPAAERAAKRPAWLNDVTRYHNRGDIAWSSCSEQCFEQGDFYGLDDLFTERPDVVRGLADVYAGWIARYRVDGFRIDTARHVDRAFFRVWVPRVLAAARRAGVPDFQLFGEAFIASAVDLAPFVRDRGLPNVLDFPFQAAATAFVSGGGTAGALASLLQDDDYFATRAGRAHTPPTFLGNHDMGRAAYQVRLRAHGLSGEPLLRRTLLGYDVMYLLRGAPTVYYGDEVGLVGSGGDRPARQDLFPTRVAEWQTEERIGSGPIGTGSSFAAARHPVADRIAALAAIRSVHPALATGATAVRLARGGLLAVSRFDADARREYVAAFNAGTAPARVSLRTATGGTTWTPVLGTDEAPASAADGRLVVTVPGLAAVLLRADADLPGGPPTRPRLTVVADAFTDGRWARATVAGSAPVSVGFAVRRGNGPWRRLAADDSPPYRALLDPAGFRRNERVALVAIARSLDGRTAVSPVVRTTIRKG